MKLKGWESYCDC